MRHTIFLTISFPMSLFACAFLGCSSLQGEQLEESQIVVFPFDQVMSSQNVPWISEGLADLICQTGQRVGLTMISRSDRLEAYSLRGLSPDRRPTLAMQIKMAESLQATHLIYGHYQTDGKTLSAEISFLDLQQLSLLKKCSITTDLADLPNIIAELCQKLFADRFHDSPSLCERSEEKISGQAYEWYIKALMEDSYEQKEEYLQRALKISTDFHQAQIQLGKLYFDNLQLDRAEDILSTLVHSQSRWTGQACLLLGEIFLEKRDYPSAIQILKRAIFHEESGQAHLLLARSYFHLGDLENSFQEADLSLKLDPMNIDAQEFKKSLERRRRSSDEKK